MRDSSQPQRRAECLCIYAARRGILEVSINMSIREKEYTNITCYVLLTVMAGATWQPSRCVPGGEGLSVAVLSTQYVWL